MSSALETLSRRFRRFGERECLPASPLYARLAVGVAEAPDLLEIAAAARAQPVPNLFFGAVHYLLLHGSAHRLASFYPDLVEGWHALDRGDPFPSFRSFCLEHAAAIRHQLATRLVQTNEVRRCACLLPAFAMAALRAGGRPLALVEVGSSAGLNLLWDHYHYDYGRGGQCGDPASPVRLACELRGEALPPLPSRMPAVAARVGLDLNPIDVRDPDAALWLRALIWPEQVDRAALLSQAFLVAQQNPPPLIAGDALDLLPGLLKGIPEAAAPCIYHTFALNQFSRQARQRFAELIGEQATERDLALIGIEWREPYPSVELALFEQGTRIDLQLANCEAHGSWLEWL